MTVRPASWTSEADGIRAIDTSFTTDRVYRFGRERGGFGFALPLLTTTPISKSYPLPQDDPGEGAFEFRAQAKNLVNAIADETSLKQLRNQIALNPPKSHLDQTSYRR